MYARECAARPGFSMSFSDPGASRTSFGDYRRLCAKWQHTITGGLRAALQSKNYVQMRNAFLILNTTVKARACSSNSRLRAALPCVARGASWPSSALEPKSGLLRRTYKDRAEKVRRRQLTLTASQSYYIHLG